MLLLGEECTNLSLHRREDHQGLQSMKLLVVIGDTHGRLDLALEGITRIEAELGQTVDQVFSVGDMGLFLASEDWDYLTGPKKYRRPEESVRILRALREWRWPLAMIAGNHEPFHRLRAWDPSYFLGKITYTDAGELPHLIEGLRVAGLSGIHHPGEMEFVSQAEKHNRKLPRCDSWPQMVDLVARKAVSPKRLAYFKHDEIECVMNLPKPHLLLLHDWPITPPHLPQEPRPETRIVEMLRPDFVCCGHHHLHHRFELGSTRGIALNLITSSKTPSHRINPGWAALFHWDGTRLFHLGDHPS